MGCPFSYLQWGRNFFVTEILMKKRHGKQSTILQWGRNFFVTEISLAIAGTLSASTLQWGRNFFVTEISIGAADNFGTSRTFNGAVTFSLRKFPVDGLFPRRPRTPSMGP